MDSNINGPWNPHANPAKHIPVITVITAVSGPLESLIARELAKESEVSLQRRCADLGELLGVAQAGIGKVAIISSELPGFDRHFIAQLRAAGVEALAINDSDDQYSAQRIAALGVRYSFKSNEVAEKLLQTITETATAQSQVSPVLTDQDRAAKSRSTVDPRISNAVLTQALIEETSRDSARYMGLDGEAWEPHAQTSHDSGDPGFPFGVPVYSSGSLDIEKTISRSAIEHLRSEDNDSGHLRVSNVEGESLAGPVSGSPSKDVGDHIEGNLPQPDFHAVPSTQYADDQRGKTIVVWSGHGAPGRSTIAAGLAFALSQPRELATDQDDALSPIRRVSSIIKNRVRTKGPLRADPTLLIDADTYAPSQVQALGLLEESSGLAQACRSANSGLLNQTSMAEAALTIAPAVRLLTGIPRPDRWSEVTETALEAVFEQATQDYAWVVVDCAPSTELDESFAYGSKAPQRNGATLAALGHADLVVVVGKPDPVGIKRLINAVNELKESPGAAVPQVIAVNHAPSRVSGKGRRTQIEKALKRFANIDELQFLAYDLGAATGALEIGQAITENDSSSELVNAVHGLARLVRSGFGVATVAPRG